MTPRQLTMPALDDIQELTPADLNNIRLSSNHTVLTPKLLKESSSPTASSIADNSGGNK